MQLIFTIAPTKDGFLTQGSQSNNEGANVILRIISSDKNRPVISFDQNEINSKLVNGRTLQSATLRLYVTDNGNNWGANGNHLAIHRLLSDWQEGNGWNVGNSIIGTGTGVTWACPVDGDISNNQNDCSTQWDGGSFSGITTDTELVTNNIVNQWIEFNVTSDVQSFIASSSTNHGWIIKKNDESLNGSVEFASKEFVSNIPQLVLVVNLSQGEILFNQYTDLVTELGNISQISDEAVVADYLVDSITKLKTDTQNLVTDVNARQNLVSILDSALQSANNGGNSVLALDEAGANLKITESRTFIDDYASQVGFLSGTTIPTSTADLLIAKAQQILVNSLKRGSDIVDIVAGTPLAITGQIINRVQTSVANMRSIAVNFESIGFTVNTNVQRNSPTTASVSFSNDVTSQLFEISIPNGTLAALTTFGFFEDAFNASIVFTTEEFATLMNVTPLIIEGVVNSPSASASLSFVRSALCRGNTGIFICVTLPNLLNECFAIEECQAIVIEFTTKMAENGLNGPDNTIPKVIVIKEVINDNGGILTPANFTIHVNGSNPKPDVFTGKSESEGGETVRLAEGHYFVTEDPVSGYTTSFTLGGCDDTAEFGVTKICRITNNDNPPPFPIEDWQYREHDVYAIFDPAWTFSKEGSEPKRIVFSTTTNSLGSAYLFKTFNKADIAGREIKITWQGTQTAGSSDGADFEVLDGAYDKTSLSDFPTNAGRAVKGGGDLGSIRQQNSWGRITQTLTPNWQASTLDQVTIFVTHFDAHSEGAHELRIEKIEIVGFATFVFRDPTKTVDAASGCDCGTYTANESPELSTLDVIQNVVNNFGQAFTPSAFTIRVSGNGPPNPAVFSGSSAATRVFLETGLYSVSVDPKTLYDSDFDGCSGIIQPGQTITCTITTRDLPPPPGAPQNVFLSGGGWIQIPANLILARDGDFNTATSTGTNSQESIPAGIVADWGTSAQRTLHVKYSAGTGGGAVTAGVTIDTSIDGTNWTNRYLTGCACGFSEDLVDVFTGEFRYARVTVTPSGPFPAQASLSVFEFRDDL